MARLTDKDGEDLEFKLQRDLKAYLKRRGWFVQAFTGNAYQTGVPDLFVFHPDHDFRWIDLKRPDRYEFTKAQRAKWPEWHAGGVGVWILTGIHDYDKLFGPPNWRDYWKERYGNINDEIDELAREYARDH
jgi:hypothetical protein